MAATNFPFSIYVYQNTEEIIIHYHSISDYRREFKGLLVKTQNSPNGVPIKKIFEVMAQINPGFSQYVDRKIDSNTINFLDSIFDTFYNSGNLKALHQKILNLKKGVGDEQDTELEKNLSSEYAKAGKTINQRGELVQGSSPPPKTPQKTQLPRDDRTPEERLEDELNDPRLQKLLKEQRQAERRARILPQREESQAEVSSQPEPLPQPTIRTERIRVQTPGSPGSPDGGRGTIRRIAEQLPPLLRASSRITTDSPLGGIPPALGFPSSFGKRVRDMVGRHRDNLRRTRKKALQKKFLIRLLFILLFFLIIFGVLSGAVGPLDFGTSTKTDKDGNLVVDSYCTPQVVVTQNTDFLKAYKKDEEIVYGLTVEFRGTGLFNEASASSQLTIQSADVTVLYPLPPGVKFISANLEGKPVNETYEGKPTDLVKWELKQMSSYETRLLELVLSPTEDNIWITTQATARVGEQQVTTRSPQPSAGPSQGLVCVNALDPGLASFFEGGGVTSNVSPALIYAIAYAENGGSVHPSSPTGNGRLANACLNRGYAGSGGMHPISCCGAHGIMQIQHINDGLGIDYGPLCASADGTSNPPEIWDGLKAKYNEKSGGKLENADNDEDSIYGGGYYNREVMDGYESMSEKGYLDQLNEEELRTISRRYLGAYNGPYADMYVNAYRDAFAGQGTCK